ncbi:4'-phosphopantetheinyl transferase [Meira miltonrushii]|uniref:holo-[acyl-carrier-protein] synthase n=1 Tax=Meira miltonrushii TaxID=1280837 RepID=A0A316V596_9BASI|nr:4'-phosphopantetheinyl transferase [Meira miltonrushii]PWN32749.1 4'-phosphopantetheinyl transferase [Meira miltonrushii]
MDCKVQVWAVDISEFKLWKNDNIKDDGLIDSFLPTKEEQDKVRRYVREIDQIRSLTGKILAHYAVCSTFGDTIWGDIRFQVGQSGRPYLAKPQHAFDYNITHDGDWVAIAFARRPSLQQSPPFFTSIGIDVMEVHLPSFEQDAESFVETMEITLTESERKWILDTQPEDSIALVNHQGVSGIEYQNAQESERLRRLYTLWTYKEAFTKAHGVGLSFDFSRLELAMWNRHTPQSSILSIQPAQSKGNRDVNASDISDTQNCHFDEIHLPPGEFHRSVYLGKETIKGGGTGSGSILVICSRKDELQVSQVPHSGMTASQAEKEGLVKMWTLEELMVKSKECMNGTTKAG